MAARAEFRPKRSSIRRLVNAAAKGDLKAIQLLLRLKERYQDSSAESIDPEDLESDKEILDAYVSKLTTGPQTSALESVDVNRKSKNSQISPTVDRANGEGEEP